MTCRPTSLRFAVALLGSATALACAGPAAAAFAPKLVVGGARQVLGATGGVTLRVNASTADQAVARATVYAPPGYAATLKQKAGAAIGSASIRLKPLAGSALALRGQITVADPAVYADNTCAPGAHDAVWLLGLGSGARTLVLPAYVDTVKPGAEAALGAVKIQVCLPSPEIPEAAGGAPLGARLLELVVTTRAIFTNPVQKGEYRWLGFFAPYFRGTRTVNALATRESRGIVRLPVVLNLQAKFVKKRRAVALSGSLTENGDAVREVNVRLYAGRRLLRTVRTNAAGRYSVLVKKLKRGVTIRATAAAGASEHACAGISVAPGGCSAATVQPFRVAATKKL